MVEITLPIVFQFLQTVGLLVGIFYYLIIMRNSQRTRELTLQSQELARKAQEQAGDTRQAQLFMQVISQWSQPNMVESMTYWGQLEITSAEEFAELWVDPETKKIMTVWALYLEGIGVLVRENLLDIKFIAQLFGGGVKSDWEKVAPYINEFREKYKAPRSMTEVEYLYDELMNYAEEHPELGIQKSEFQVFGRQ